MKLMKRVIFFLLIFSLSFVLSGEDVDEISAVIEEESVNPVTVNPPEAPSEPVTGIIKIEKSGGSGDFSVYINGEIRGENLNEINSLSPGEYLIEIRQQRLTGEQILLSKSISLSKGETLSVPLKIPESLGSEKAIVSDLKKRIEKALANGDTLLDLRTETENLLEQMPDWMDEKVVLKDYYLKLKIEIEKRLSTTAFIFGDVIDLDFWQKDYQFADYNSHVTLATYDYQWALKYVLILKRLEILKLLNSRDFEAFRNRVADEEELLSLAGRVSTDFAMSYKRDFLSLINMFEHYVETQVIAKPRGLEEALQRRYGELWFSLNAWNDNKLALDSREVLAFKASYDLVDTDNIWDFENSADNVRKVKFNLFIGGGSLLTAGILWEPATWFGLAVGVGGAYDFIDRTSTDTDRPIGENDPSLAITLPLEADFFIVNKKLEIFLGLTTDIIRVQDKPTIHWSNENVRNEDGLQTGSILAFLTTVGFNLGIGIDLGKVDLYISNYLYFTDTNFRNFSPDTLGYSPAIGIRL